MPTHSTPVNPSNGTILQMVTFRPYKIKINQRTKISSTLSLEPIHSDKPFGKRRRKLASDMPSPLMVQQYTSSLGMIRAPSTQTRTELCLKRKPKIILQSNRTFSIGMLIKIQRHHSELLSIMMNSTKTSSPITTGIGQDTEPNHQY